MKFQSRVTVVGMKANKGSLDNGTTYDSTKAYVLLSMDSSKGKQRGQSVGEFNIGLSAEFDKYSEVPLPFEAEADMELVTNGSTTKTVIHGLKPVGKAKAA